MIIIYQVSKNENIFFTILDYQLAFYQTRQRERGGRDSDKDREKKKSFGEISYNLIFTRILHEIWFEKWISEWQALMKL